MSQKNDQQPMTITVPHVQGMHSIERKSPVKKGPLIGGINCGGVLPQAQIGLQEGNN